MTAARPDNSRGGPTVSNPTRWVGIDLHRRRSQIAIVDEHGELSLSRRIVNDRDAFRELLGDANGTHVALEATYGWEWLAELLQEGGYDLHLAHPLRTQAIAAARVKTDAVDAKTLAHLLRTGLLPEAYIAPGELRDLRELLPHRPASVRLGRARAHRAQLRRQGAPGAHLPPGLARAALGADRGRAEDPHRRRSAARHLRADRQTSRAQNRQGRGRPPNPHPLLLRAARRRDPLPQTPARRRPRQPGAGRGRMTHASSHQTRAHQGARCKLGRARSCVWPPSPTRAGRP